MGGDVVSEAWKPVVGYEGLYEVSDEGSVKRVAPAQGTQPGRILKPIVKKRGGYIAVGLRKSGSVRKLKSVHRMVAEAFLGGTDMPLVRHMDGNPKNNRVDNLRWGTESENAFDRVRHGTQHIGNQNSIKTHCKNGHEFTPENTYRKLHANGKRYRQCRTCRREDSRKQEELRRMKRLALAV